MSAHSCIFVVVLGGTKPLRGARLRCCIGATPTVELARDRKHSPSDEDAEKGGERHFEAGGLEEDLERDEDEHDGEGGLHRVEVGGKGGE